MTTTMSTMTTTPSSGNNNNIDNKNNNNKNTMTTTTIATKKSFVVNDASNDIPIFLRKTYHMVDTCDPAVCSWSEDGETFVVKHPKKFEQEIIPQFFKHSKFSSFVRQLNFYAFRKIKTNDSIRIDTALEAATANYWRFYHPKFQRGKPESLQEIKRSSSTPRGAGSANKKGSGNINSNGNNILTTINNNSKNNAVTPDAAPSSGAVVGRENYELKSEVTNLKERLEAMNKNIDVLTTMVQNVTMSQKTTEAKQGGSSAVVLNENNKRSKTTTSCVPDDMISSSIAVPDGALSMPSPICLGATTTATSSNPLQLQPNTNNIDDDLSDQGFVDTLFTAFKGDDDEDNDLMGDVIDLVDPDSPWLNSSSMSSSASISPSLSSTNNNNNIAVDANQQRPRAELMNRLSDALSLLPREIQELIVDRLIQAITSPKEIRESLQVTEALKDVVATTTNMATRDVPMSVPQSPRHTSAVAFASDDDSAMMTDDDHSTAAASVTPVSAVPASPRNNMARGHINPSLPLAAATLAALLSQYGKEPQCAAAVVAATNVLIPVHV